MQPTSMASSDFPKPVGTGGFLNPEKIVNEFGLRENMIVADFGCGSGYFTILLGQRVGQGGKVYGVDVQETALDSVRVKAKAAGLENIETIRSNLEVLGSSGLADSSQDMVLLANVLFQSSQKEEIIKEAKRVTKEGGTVIVIDWKMGTGGFGPPDSLRTDDVAMRSLVIGEGLSFERDIDAGQFHYGMIFKK